jgi:hypothetical protein
LFTGAAGVGALVVGFELVVALVVGFELVVALLVGFALCFGVLVALGVETALGVAVLGILAPGISLTVDVDVSCGGVIARTAPRPPTVPPAINKIRFMPELSRAYLRSN